MRRDSDTIGASLALLTVLCVVLAIVFALAGNYLGGIFLVLLGYMFLSMARG